MSCEERLHQPEYRRISRQRTHDASASDDDVDRRKLDIDRLRAENAVSQRTNKNRPAKAHLVDPLVNSHELGRRLLHALVPNPDEILSLLSSRRNEVAELGLLLDHLVLDVEGAKEDVDAHVERAQTEFELEAFEDGVDEEAIGLGGVDVGAEDGGLDAVDVEREFERLLVEIDRALRKLARQHNPPTRFLKNKLTPSAMSSVSKNSSFPPPSSSFPSASSSSRSR